ncbi:hypothetical protein N327_06783, partial [Fulmarus glacialis]
MVQPVPPVTLGCWGTPVGGERDSGGQHGPGVGRSWQARSRGKTLGSQALGRVGGRRLPLRQGARGSDHVQRWAMPPQGRRGWESSVLPTLTPKQPLPHPVPGARSPAPATSPPSVAVQRCCIPRRSPGPSPGAGEHAAPARQQGQAGNRKDALEGSASKR